MKPPSARFFLAGFLLPCAFLALAHARQSSTNPGAGQPAADPIIGFWKLNPEKSTNPGVESELLTVTREGELFHIDLQAMQSNKYNPHYQVSTDMRGSTSKLVEGDGKPTSIQWRITRERPNAFVVESIGPSASGKKEYAVSPDGRTLTVHELTSPVPALIVSKIDANGAMNPVKQVLVFEKIPDSAGRALSKQMTEIDAAQKAEASKRDAAQAARDAVACSPTSGQPDASASTPGQAAWREYACPQDGFGITLPNPPKKHSLQHDNFYELYRTQDESIVAQLYVSANPTECAGWLKDMRTTLNRPLPPGLPQPPPGTKATAMTKETTFQGSPAFESLDPHSNGPMYLQYDLTQCSGNRVYIFHARWLRDHPKPEEVTRIFDSFRRLTKETNQ